MHNAGLVVETAILVAVAVHIGGIIGGIVASDLFDRTGRARFYVLGALYIFACLFTASIGVAGNSVLWTTVAVFVAGFFVYGLQNTYQAIISVVYPTEMRSTGTSWGIGVMPVSYTHLDVYKRQDLNRPLFSSAASLAPDQEQADIAGHAAGEIEHPGRKMEAAWFQVALPAQVDLRRLAAQRLGPARQRRVDFTPAVAAQAARKA